MRHDLALIVACPAGMSKLVQVSLMVVTSPGDSAERVCWPALCTRVNRRMKAFLVELQQGAPPEELVAHHVNSLCPCGWVGFAEAGLHQKWGRQTWRSGFLLNDCVSYHEWITGCLRRLHDAKIGIYGRMNVQSHGIKEIIPSPETGLAITRAEALRLIRTPQTKRSCSPLNTRSTLRESEFADRAARVTSRWRKSGTGDAKGRWVQVFWRLRGQADYVGPNRYVFLWDPGKDEQIVWIFGTIEQIALHFGDRPVQRSLRLEDLPMSVLLPAGSLAKEARL